ncbi:MAG: glycosyltransferase [Bacteroidales bacterium]|nr:glycosyltransferase [Bacteroidales bacterium]
MTLSIVIVNYNVKYFLEQCLRSVNEAAQGIDTEVWVVDNNSVDGSVEMVRDKFPQVHLIANSDNTGFAKANNQAIRECKGDYILLLNPDTLVQNDTFSTCLDFFREHPDCGALSVKMVNGEGVFLKESKRGFPSPATSFYKISGLIHIFPHNRKISAYYMGYLDDNNVNEVDVLPGAFLMARREAIDKAGMLDETYFMYGEDIDFSWRIHLAGYKNYYLPTTRILHYKGESTKKGSMNYVYTFYNAMSIFTKKYFSGSGAKLYALLIQCAIWLRASLDFAKRIVKHLVVPFLDFVASFAGFLVIQHIWASYWAENINYYPSFYKWTILPLYILIMLLTSWLAGGYDKPVRTGRIVQGMAIGALLLLAFYSLLDENLRFSRAIILLGSLWSILAVLSIRGLLSLFNVKGYQLHPDSRRDYMIIGSDAERQRVATLFDTLGIEPKSVQGSDTVPLQHNSMPKVDEVILCSRDIPVSTILDTLQEYRGSGIVFRIAPHTMDVIIGSNYTSSTEELYTPDFGNINNATNRRIKRVFDILSASLLILLSPLLFWFQKRKRRYFTDCFAVLFGRKSWVGYSNMTAHPDDTPLPSIRRGVFSTRDRMPRVKNPDKKRLDSSYATDYHIGTDITILFINLFKI